MRIIVHRSAAIATFFALLALPAAFSKPQTEHLQRLADVLVLAPRRKTLAELAATELDGVDPSNLADFFRISPWDADTLYVHLCELVLRDLRQRLGDTKEPLYLILDDSLANKDKGTRKLEPVDWFFDHKLNRPVQASNHVSLSISWGNYYFPLLTRLYLRACTVRKRNRSRRRAGQNLLRYVSKPELALQMLQQVSRLLPPGVPVYVLFDSWYTSAKMVRWIRQQGWHVIAAIKSNRSVSGQKLSAWHHELKRTRYARVSLALANGKQRTYRVRSLRGRLRNVPGTVHVLISQKDRGHSVPRYFLSTDLTLTCAEILKKYQTRWRIETDYWQVKTYLGLGDYRLQSYEAIAKWYAAVQLVLTYLYWRKYEAGARCGRTTSLSEVLQEIRRAQQREWLQQACAEAAAGIPLEEVLHRYLGEGKPAA
jgi:hypothetical protein